MNAPSETDCTQSATSRQLERISQQLQQIHVSLDTLRVSLQTVAGGTRDHERRLRLLERWKHHLTPVLAALTFTLGAVVTSTLSHLF